MGRLETLSDVPSDAVEQVVCDFESEGASVVLTRQQNGAWTVVAEFDEVDGLEETQYRLYVLHKVQKGLTSIEDGRGIEHQQVVDRLKRWPHE